MNLFYFIGVLWLICWYIYFFTSDTFPYKKQIVYFALLLIISIPFKANFGGIKLNVYILIFCIAYLFCFFKSSLFMQFSLIASLLIVMIIHFVFYLTSIVNPKMFFGFQSTLEVLINYILLTICLKKSLAIFSTAAFGIAFSEVFIQIFNFKTFGVSMEQIDSSFPLIAWITLLAFVQFVIGLKGKRSRRRLLL